jgi:glycosyltransferase involved in cell wall biosynthesis
VAEPVPIAFCITDLDPGGAERALVQIVTRLSRAEWDPAVYCLAPRGELASVLDQHRIPVTCFGAKSSRDFPVIGALSRRLRDQHPRIVQTFLIHANIAGRIAARRAGVPIVVSGIRVAERGRPWHLWLERITRSKVTHHVCVSRSVAEFSISKLGLKPDRVSFIPNGVDVDLFANAVPADLSSFGITRPSRTLLFVGRLHKQKGIVTFLDAVRPLVERHDELNVLLVGAGPLEKQIRRWIHREELDHRILLPGQRNDVPSLMRACSAIVLPSLWEGLPNVVLEAMAAGLPVIATDVDGSRELVVPGTTGWLAEAGSSTSLRAAIEGWLTADTATVQRVTQNAKTFVTNDFTWGDAASSYASLYRRLLNQADPM